jgi:uncharacterized lipoprotein YddW (UPF0748 family)
MVYSFKMAVGWIRRLKEAMDLNRFAAKFTANGMNFKKQVLAWLLALLLASPLARAVNYVPSTAQPPAPSREFRAMWIATMVNIDWPSQPGLSVSQQKAELIAILDCAVRLNLNAVIFQVRPGSDALYASSIEPWSYYLTGAMGKAPSPYYDPLAFAVEEAHKRGLELHAYFNPFRAGQPSRKWQFSSNHISRTRPDLVRQYGNLLWLDPGEKEAQEHVLKVVMDVVNRYDIDAVHFDDYFYPYKQQDARNRDIDFPDTKTWKRYVAAGGKLSRDDWRRENINSFVHRVHDSIHAAKPWVKFGISPFGIWQPGYPPQIKGLNAYESIYADSRKWLMNGWVDYMSPQLYWAVESPGQSFPVLLKWWLEQNPKHRNVWPGIASEKVGKTWKANEIIRQIQIIREQCGDRAGEALYSAEGLVQNRGGLASALAQGVYSRQALIPSSPWLNSTNPAQPKLTVTAGGKLRWEPVGKESPFLWVVQMKTKGQWQTSIFPEKTRSYSLAGTPEIVAVTAVNRCGMAGLPMVLQREERSSK